MGVRMVATLGPSVRLVVLQFLVPEHLVPAVVPPKGLDKSPSATLLPSSGVEVLKSHSGVYLLHLFDGICPGDGQGSYELVDAWFTPAPRHFGKSAIRYVLCHKEHVKPDELFPGFVAKRDELIDSLVNLADDNLWAVQGHLNPYFDKDGRPSNHKVLMLGCAGRMPTIDSAGNTIKVYRDGRDVDNRGLGPKVPMRDKAPQLNVAGNEIVLTTPVQKEVPVA